MDERSVEICSRFVSSYCFYLDFFYPSTTDEKTLQTKNFRIFRCLKHAQYFLEIVLTCCVRKRFLFLLKETIYVRKKILLVWLMMMKKQIIGFKKLSFFVFFLTIEEKKHNKELFLDLKNRGEKKERENNNNKLN